MLKSVNQKKKIIIIIIYRSSGEDELGSFDVISETSAGTSDATINKVGNVN